MENIETIGIRAFSQAVSSYLRKVQLGVRILISDRGKVIGELVQPGRNTQSTNPNVPPQAEKLVADGTLSLGHSLTTEENRTFKFPRGEKLTKVKSLKILDELRGEK